MFSPIAFNAMEIVLDTGDLIAVHLTKSGSRPADKGMEISIFSETDLGCLTTFSWELSEKNIFQNGGGGKSRATWTHPIEIRLRPPHRFPQSSVSDQVWEVGLRENFTYLSLGWGTEDAATMRQTLGFLLSTEIFKQDRIVQVYVGDTASSIANYFPLGFGPKQPVPEVLMDNFLTLQFSDRINLDFKNPLPSNLDSELQETTRDSNRGGETPQSIESITVSGLRGFREAGTLELARPNNLEGSGLTMVVGANNAGKSTLWEAFEASGRSFRQPERVSFSEGVRNQGADTGVLIRIKWNSQQIFTLHSLSKDSSETKHSWADENNSYEAEERLLVVPSRRYFQANFHKSENYDPQWMLQSSEFSRGESKDNFTARLFAIHRDVELKSKLDELMKKITEHQFDWSIELSTSGLHYLKIRPADREHHSSEGLGDGITSLLFIASALIDSQPGGTVVIDEPELSLHPQLLKRLSKVFGEYSRDRQVVIFTHSPSLIDWEQIENGATVARVYHADGSSRVAQPENNTLKRVAKLRGERDWRNPHALGPAANEVFFLEDKVVLVEGQEDVVLMPKVYELLKMEQGGTFFGWGAAGAKNFDHLLELLHGLKFRRVAAILDGDTESLDIARKLSKDFANYRIENIPAEDIRTKEFGNKSVQGILDKGGKAFNPNLSDDTEEAMRNILSGIEDYFRDT